MAGVICFGHFFLNKKFMIGEKMKIKKIILTVACLFMFANSVFATEDYGNSEESAGVDDSITFDSETVKQDCDKKHYFIGAGGVLVVNAVIGGWNRFVSRAPWAQVGWDDVKEFWKKEIKYDKDWYWTNFVLHPYQGGLYYLAARNANLNLFESLLYATAGSLMWEYFYETNSPSTNDMVYTSIGGMVTGEMLYRLSLEAQGKKYKVLSFIANPVRLYSDPLEGHGPVGPTGQLQDCSLKVMMGFDVANSWFRSSDESLREVFPINGGIELRTVYADPYGHDSNTPYSQFYFEFGGSGGKGSGEGASKSEKKVMYDVHIFSDGMLWSRAPDFGETVDTTVGLVMEYDFVWNSFMEFSSLAPGFAWKQRFNGEKSSFAYQARASWVIMGTSDFIYLRRGNTLIKPEDGVIRDYGYSTGAEFVVKLAAARKNGIEFDWTVHNYGLFKYKGQRQELFYGVYDATGWEYLGFSDLTVEIPVSKIVSIGVSDEVYFKSTWYREYEDHYSIYNAFNLYARFKFM